MDNNTESKTGLPKIGGRLPVDLPRTTLLDCGTIRGMYCVSFLCGDSVIPHSFDPS
jgi:hypothetical protein